MTDVTVQARTLRIDGHPVQMDIVDPTHRMEVDPGILHIRLGDAFVTGLGARRRRGAGNVAGVGI